MAKYVDLYDDRNYYIGEDGEYQKWNIDPKAIEEATDIVEVVRCKDCKNWDTTWQNDWAKDYHYCPLVDGTRKGDWYCADAERRTE